MSQYPKWFLAINFPNIIFAMAMMTFFMFGGVHPFGDVDSVFWSFIIYLFTQLLWMVPIVLFFISVFAWGWARERLAVGCCAAGWVVNVIAFLLLYNA